MKKYPSDNQEDFRKRKLEGTSLSNQNSFAALNNMEIVEMVSGMGIIVAYDQFDSIELMKDLEVARHALKVTKIHELPVEMKNYEEVSIEDFIDEARWYGLALEWHEDGSESDPFTLVGSKKKKRERLKMENMVKQPSVRSRRTTPSLYRKSREQENSAALSNSPKNQNRK
jgi:hypothetical protein